MGRTLDRFCIRLQQRLSEYLVLFLPSRHIIFVGVQIVFFEVLQSTIQLGENMIQVVDKICSMVSHPDSPEVLPNRDPHQAETAGDIVGGAGRVGTWRTVGQGAVEWDAVGRLP